jgi:hypothetical protein
MASIGMALLQGQKNAQEMALGQISTMSGMAEAAKKAEQAGEYFDPTNVALRERTLLEKDQQLEALKTLDSYSKEMAVDPVAASTKVLNKTTGGDWTIAQEGDKYVAREWIKSPDGVLRPGARQLEFASKEQLANTAMRNLTATTSDILSDYRGKADAQITAQLKAAEKDWENQSAYKWLKRPEFANKKEIVEMQEKGDTLRAKIAAGASMYGSDSGRLSANEVARIKQEADDGKVLDFVKGKMAIDFGAKYDEKGRLESVGGQPIETLAPEVRRAFDDRENEYIQSAFEMGRRGGARVTGNPETVKRMRAAGAAGLPMKASHSSDIPAGMPTAAPDAKAKRLANNAEAEARAEYERIRREADPNYKPRFY